MGPFPRGAEGRQLLARHSEEDDFADSGDDCADRTYDIPVVVDSKKDEEMTLRTKICLSLGLGIMAITFGIDVATTSSYSSYALSSFKKLSQQGLLDVIDSTVTAALKLPIAKTSDVLGRAETYCFMMLLYAAGHIIRATAPSFAVFIIGTVFYGAGQAGTAILNLVLISDVTTMRTRGLASNAFYLSILVTPWASGLVVDSVVDGVGWRWGYGMFAIIMPFGGAVLIATLFHLQRNVKAIKITTTSRHTIIRQFCSQTDMGGLALLCGGLAALLLPMLLASQSRENASMLWAIPVMAIGGICLLGVWPYEKYIAQHPAVPTHYFRDRSIVFALLLCCFDAIGFRATHTYLFPWSVAAHNFSPGHALYLSYTNGITQCITGLITGYFMYRKRSYKWITVAGSIIRLFGYGIMVRLRTNHSTVFELFFVQVIQGIGSGVIETTAFVAAQIVTPTNELAQVTGLIAMSLHLGGGVGAAIAGWIYNNQMKARLRVRLGSNVDEWQIEDLFDSINGMLPEWGSEQRKAVGIAYSDVLGNITLVALAISLPLVLFALVMPNKKLSNDKSFHHYSTSEDEFKLREFGYDQILQSLHSAD